MTEKKIKATLWYTSEVWQIISKKAEELHPGKGVTHMINVALQKEVHRSKLSCEPCTFEKAEKVQLCYAIPDNLIEGVRCLCKRWSITPAALISRIAIEPHLMDR